MDSGIGSLDSIPGLLKRLQIRLGLHLLAELVPWNRFLGSLNVYKYGLRLHWIAELVPWNRFLGSLNLYKYGLRLHWIAELVSWNRFLGSLNVYKYGLRLGTMTSGIGFLESIPRLHNMKNEVEDDFFWSEMNIFLTELSKG